MSIHHLSVAGMLDMPAAKKLVFMAVCDDASSESGEGFPGMEKIQRWSGLKSKSRVLELLGELIDDGYLERTEPGRKGHRAVFRVFAGVACCPLHDQFLGSGPSDPTEIGSDPSDPEGAIGSDKGSDKGSDSYRTPPLSPISTETLSSFQAFYAAYPRRVGRGQALKAWRVALKKADAKTITDAAEAFAARCTSSDPKFIPYPATWLNGERWADETEEPATPSDPRSEWWTA